MPLKIDSSLTPKKLQPKVERLFEYSAQKILDLERSWKPEQGTPVFTANGKYTSRGWTEWTQGFQFGSALLQFDATGDREFLELGRRKTVALMASHVSHIGVHDHGFNNVSTYGNLLRLMREGKMAQNDFEEHFYELALKTSGAVQAARWTQLAPGAGYIYSFNGPHSLFIDTLRSLRSLAVAHRLGHSLMGERDQKISLLDRLVQHAITTTQYNIYFGRGRDAYDVRGRVAHESLFNLNDGSYRCPSSQQGYSPFTTWTRGAAWALLGCAELLEFWSAVSESEARRAAPALHFHAVFPWITEAKRPGQSKARDRFAWLLLETARAVAENFTAICCADGIPMWDSGAPNLHRLGDYGARPADPYNPFEPVDSSAAAIAAQGLMRLGQFLEAHENSARAGRKWVQAGLTIANALFDEPYLSTSAKHQGLILHSIYHRPNGWDSIAPGQKVPNGESSMWGDYHARELALLLLRQARGEPYLTFFGGVKHRATTTK
ncbi:MAG: glycosyl hydrolase [Verrucomicrobiota bacterium]